MRMHLQAHLQKPSAADVHIAGVPVTVTLRPSNNQPGEYAYKTDCKTLIRLLRNETDLSGLAIEQFEGSLRIGTQARLPAVALKDRVLQDIGYFMA